MANLILNTLLKKKKINSKLTHKHHNYSHFNRQVEELSRINLPNIGFDDFIETIKSSENFPMFIEIMNNIQMDYIYKSHTHGIFHNERVALISFYIANKMNLNKRDTELALYAAMYHDIGRVDDFYDEEHGERSAKMLDKLNLPVDNEELNILKAAIFGHSIDDRYFERICSHFEIKDMERCINIFNILKDSDGLDRVRLPWPYVSGTFLRTPNAPALIPVAYELENAYEILEEELNSEGEK